MKFLIPLILLIAGCSPQIPRDADTFYTSASSDPDILNPVLSNEAFAGQIFDYINDTLIDRDRDTQEFIPELAERWTVSPDHLQYTFHLRKDVKWHDGQPFTADDVIYSFNKIQDPEVEAPFLRVYYADIEKLEKLDDHTIRFTYRKPYFMALSVCGTIPLLPKHIFDDGQDFNKHSANRHPIGTGPFEFAEWTTGRKVVLKRNENYWGKKPAFKKVIFSIISDDTVRLQVLKKGELDMLSLRPIQWARQTESKDFNERFGKYRYTSPGYSYIAWNSKNPLFTDKRVRQALTQLIDRDKIMKKLQFGQGIVVASPFFIESPQYHPTLKPWPYDVAAAKTLLAEVGYADTDGDGFLDKDGKKFTFTFRFPSASKTAERISTIMKEDFKDAGIDMNIERMEWAVFLEKLQKKEFEATSLGWSTGFEGDPYQIWHSSQSTVDKGNNFVSFENKEADSLIENARSEFDPQKRNAMYHRLQEIIHDEQPYTFLFSSYSLVVVSKRFDNVIVHKMGMDPQEWTIK